MANILGSAGNDTLFGDTDPLNLDDTLNSGWLAGDDDMIGGNGNDIYNVNSLNDTVFEGAGQGTDEVRSQIVDYTLTTDVENLVLQEQDRVGMLVGGLPVVVVSMGAPTAVNGTGNALDNVITGNSNANTLEGLGGADTLEGLDGADTLNGGNGNDTLRGGAGGDTLNGGANNDQLNGQGNNDVLDGGSGNDTVDGGSGNDTMSGGTGNDTFIVDAAGDTVSENAASGTDLVQSGVTYTLTDVDVENLRLTGAGNINGTGNAGVNLVTGNGGNNVLDGAGGADVLTGGAGNDTYVLDNAADAIVEGAAAGTDLVKASFTYTLTNLNLENLTLTGAAAINGTGNLLNNVINGNGAANSLFGLNGNDSMFGSGGDDTLEGGSGLDRLHGGLGIDVLRAQTNAGDDGVEDRFYFETALNAATNWDQIDDQATFDTADGVDDEIYLQASIFTGLSVTAGALNEYYEGAGRTGNLVTDDVGIYLNTTNGQMFFNPTLGGNDSVLFAVIDNAIAGGSASLSADDFVLF